MADPALIGPSLLTLALTRWQSAETAEHELRLEGETDLQFLNLQQWDSTILSQRGPERPALTIDQIGEPYRQIVGQFRRAHPGIQISPVDNGADQDTAERYQGAIRHIEATGGAKAAREEAFKGCAGPGWGFYRLYTEFEYSQDGRIPDDPAAVFDQCIKYQPIENQFTVFRDPSTPIHEPWKCGWALQIEDVPLEAFKSRWPGRLTTAQDAFAATGLALPDWFPEGSVRVADYFYLEAVPQPEMALLSDGRALPVPQAEAELAAQRMASQPPAGAVLGLSMPSASAALTIVQRHTPTRQAVKRAKISGAEILEGEGQDGEGRPTTGREEPWPFIPIVPMWGEALTVKGKRTVRGIVRAARDPQRMYNYQNSELVYELALAPKSKVIMAEGQDEGYEDLWKRAPSEAFPALKYKPTSLMGQPVPPPQVAHYTDSTKIQALVVAINQHKSDLRSTTGWYDATDPNRKNADQSGRAILARKESQTEGSINFMESASQAIRFEAMLLLGAIPKLFNRPGRAIRIAGLEDDTASETLTIGQPVTKPDGSPGYFQWGAGRYDIRVDIGASYGTRRQEASTFQIELMKVLPPEMSAAMAPIAVRNMDGPGNREIADRLDRTLPAQIRTDPAKGSDPRQLAQENAQLKQVLQQHEAVIKGLQEAVQQEMVKAEADVKKEQTAEAGKLAIERLKAEVEAMKVRADLIKLTAELDADAGKIALQEETKRLLKAADLSLATSMRAADDDMALRGMDQEERLARMRPTGGGTGA